MRLVHAAACLLLILLASPRAAAAADATPASVADDVLAADRAFSERGAKDFLAAAEAMFAVDVTMPAPGGRLVRGRDAVLAAFRENAVNVGSRATWTPIRAGVSADGRHAFTYGYMTATHSSGNTADMKYLAYWVRDEDGAWRVAAYKRTPRAAGEVDTAMRAPALPASLVPWDAAKVDEAVRSVVAVEQAFSDEAQRIGLGPAFAKYGSVDAMNMGGPGSAEFAFSATKIAELVGAGEGPTSSVSWSAERALAASSGDLGVTFGLIRLNAPDEKQKGQPPFAFFTVWRRATPDSPWRYVAE